MRYHGIQVSAQRRHTSERAALGGEPQFDRSHQRLALDQLRLPIRGSIFHYRHAAGVSDCLVALPPRYRRSRSTLPHRYLRP